MLDCYQHEFNLDTIPDEVTLAATTHSEEQIRAAEIYLNHDKAIRFALMEGNEAGEDKTSCAATSLARALSVLRHVSARFRKAGRPRHSRPGDLVLDPFSGRGTTLLEASLLGRRAIASDVNPVAFCISAAKANPPHLGRLVRFVDELRVEFLEGGQKRVVPRRPLPDFFSVAFHRDTLSQILFLRWRLDWRSNRLTASSPHCCLHSSTANPITRLTSSATRCHTRSARSPPIQFDTGAAIAYTHRDETSSRS